MTEWLADTLVATTLLMALVLAIRGAVAKTFGAPVAYMLWLLPGARMLMPAMTETVERPAAAFVETFPAAAAVAEAPISEAAMSMPTEVPVAETSLAAQWATVGSLADFLVFAWAAGALVFFAFRITAYRRERQTILLGARHIAELGKIQLIESAAVTGPLAFGIIDRYIAVPVDFERTFTGREQELALDHELAHHKSGDLFYNLAAFAVLSVHWFNPVAWAAWRAFRFDQEAACDARVLGSINSGDRVTYGRTIAKAASGQAALFAAALDTPANLKRRLKTMKVQSPVLLRRAGSIAVIAGLAVALPLTATRAIEYVEAPTPPEPPAAPSAPSPQPAPDPAVAPLAPTAPVAPTAPRAPRTAALASQDGTFVLPDGVKLDKDSVAFFDDDKILINGKRKRLDQLTKAERSKLRAVIKQSRHDLQRERAELPERLAEARHEIERFRSGAYKQEYLADLADLRRDLAEIDREAAELRAAGEDPERVKAEIRQSIREIESMDIEKEMREALVDLDPDKLTAELRESEAQMARLQARLEKFDRSGD